MVDQPEQTERTPRKMDLNRREMPKQEPEVRSRNFFEVALGYAEETAVEEAKRCLQCKKPFCVANCPVNVPIPEFIHAIAEGDFDRGVEVLKQKNALPSVCGRVCPQEEQCESECALRRRNGTIAIGRLERFLGDWEAARGSAELPRIPPSTGKKVAIVGGGPAGLTAAADLIKLGHQVIIFEALHKMGGVLSYGIPEFRLPKKIVDREVDYLRRLGVEMRTDYVIGNISSLDNLLENYDAVFVATGAGLPWFMDMPGNNLNGVYSANEYLTRLNLMKGYEFPKSTTPIRRHKDVAVLGGGNVAMDCARTALRLGSKVSILYRRSREELPARLEEVENAEEEGVEFRFLTLPVRALSDGNFNVTGLECVRMELGEPDASGRRSPHQVPNSEFTLDFDCVIHAIGNSPNPLIPRETPDIQTNKWGGIIADAAGGRTSKKGVFAGGDIVLGAATVILAMGEGRRAAKAMHDYMTNGVW